MKASIIAWAALVVTAVAPRIAMADAPADPAQGPAAVEPYRADQASPGHLQPEMPMMTEPMPLGEEEFSNVQRKPGHIKTPNGMSIIAGGGVAGFLDGDVTDLTNPAGIYNLRLTYGTREVVGIEAAYIGTAQSIDALGLDSDALLISNGVEGLVRYNVNPRGEWQPYVAAGVGWRRYDVRSDSNTSNVLEEDDVVEIPAQLGVAFRRKGFVLDTRAGYRHVFNNDLLGTQALHTWQTNVNLGFEF